MDLDKYLTYFAVGFLVLIFVGTTISVFQGCTFPSPAPLTHSNSPPMTVYGGGVSMGA